MNLVNTEVTPIHRVLTLIRDEAARHGAAISGCEVVGLIPEAAMLDAAEHLLQLEGFRRDQVLELRLKRPPLSDAVSLGGVLDQVAAGTPTPGGGSVAAIVGALGSCLATMVANLSIGRKKYAAHDADLRALKQRAEALRAELLALARRDGEAFEAVLRAGRLPRGNPEESTAREKALGAANLEAARVPLRTAEACLEVAGLAVRAARWGNPNAVTDAAGAGLLAAAAAEGALLNVEINLKSTPESADKQGVERDLRRLTIALAEAFESSRDAVRTVLGASQG
jgi:glutamate formiminotransferase/formiminotetrahydrofolate cyclodeaminase